MKDLMGQAIWDYYYDNSPENLQTETSISELDDLPIDYLFRSFKKMNPLEQKALELTKGKALDIGSGAGSHSLFLQNEKNLEVTALDISPKSIEISKIRGVQNAICANILDFNPIKKFDTILLLMNGIGLCGTIENLKTFLKKAEELLNEDGRLVFDSSDTIYMYEHDILPERYYGEVECAYSYKNLKTDYFKWLYIDQDKLREVAQELGWEMKVLFEDNHYQYLVELKK